MQSPDDFTTQLAASGVDERSLTRTEAAGLDERGFVVLERVLSPPQLEPLRLAFETAAQPEPSGTRHVPDIVTRAAVFEQVFSEPRVLAAAWRVIARPFRVQNCGGRDPLPGFGLQGLHTDWRPRASHEPFHVATALWLLDDYTASNGATRVVPGSHRDPRPLPRELSAPNAHHPREELVAARAGDVLVFNGHLLHAGTSNGSSSTRRVLQCVFVAAELQPPSSLELPAAARALTRLLFGA